MAKDESGAGARGGRLAALAVFLFLVALVALFGTQFQPGPWYAGLTKPPLNPPNWIFGPVWSILYLAMAVAGWIVWCTRPVPTGPLALWATQLVLNAVWSPLFFGLQRPGVALLEIVLLAAMVVATTVAFFRVRPAAGWLLVPYAAWVLFAAYLNAGLWYLNR